MHELTKEEEKAIRTLRKLEKTWPKTLWLFSASGTLWVMKKGVNGVMRTDSGSMDQDFCVTNVNIENDGGDW